jgi:hypothetical protein
LSPEPRKTARGYGGKLADPAFRRDRARNAAVARTTLEAHIRAVADRAPELTAAQRERLALLLHPGNGGSDAPAA